MSEKATLQELVRQHSLSLETEHQRTSFAKVVKIITLDFNCRGGPTITNPFMCWVPNKDATTASPLS